MERFRNGGTEVCASNGWIGKNKGIYFNKLNAETEGDRKRAETVQNADQVNFALREPKL